MAFLSVEIMSLIDICQMVSFKETLIRAIGLGNRRLEFAF